MTAGELVQAMRALLSAERKAIRRLDSAAVEQSSQAKEALLAEVLRADPSERAPLLEGLALVHAELTRNLVLLAHARDCMRDAILHAQSEGGTRVSIQL